MWKSYIQKHIAAAFVGILKVQKCDSLNDVKLFSCQEKEIYDLFSYFKLNMNVDNKQKNELIKSSQFLVLSTVPSQLVWIKKMFFKKYIKPPVVNQILFENLLSPLTTKQVRNRWLHRQRYFKINLNIRWSKALIKSAVQVTETVVDFVT